MNIKGLFVAVAGAAILSAGAAVAQTKINLNSQPNEAGFPMWLANDLGYFAENGLEVDIEYFPNGGAALATGATNQWQAGWTGGPPAVSGWEKFNLVSVAAMQKESQNLKLYMRNDVLEGKTPAEALWQAPRSAPSRTRPGARCCMPAPSIWAWPIRPRWRLCR